MEHDENGILLIGRSDVATLAEDYNEVFLGGPFTNQRVEGDYAYLTDGEGKEMKFHIVSDEEAHPY